MITVLMAAKTSTEYMPQAIGSLLAQSYTDWQLTIGVNGIPTSHAISKETWHDRNVAIPNQVYLDAFNFTRAFGSRVHLIDMPSCRNKAEALNYMVSFAAGDHVAILDVDDLWHPLKLERQMKFVEFGYDVVGTQAEYFGDIHSDIGVLRGQIDLNDLCFGNCIINSSVVMKRELAHWEPMDEPIEDYELWLRLAAEGRKIFNVSEYLTFIRQHSGNWSKQSNHDGAIERLRAKYR